MLCTQYGCCFYFEKKKKLLFFFIYIVMQLCAFTMGKIKFKLLLAWSSNTTQISHVSPLPTPVYTLFQPPEMRTPLYTMEPLYSNSLK